MKLTFFLIALCLVMVRAYFSWSGHSGNGSNSGSIVISNSDYHEKIKWAGKIDLSDDEKSIHSISPGGYLKFYQDDKSLLAESNVKGEISYELYDGHQHLPLNDSGRSFISAVIREMIAWGFSVTDRPAKIFAKGGTKAVLNEIGSFKLDAAKYPYFDILFKNDSLGREDMLETVQLIGHTGADIDRGNLLKRVKPVQRKDSVISAAWIEAVSHLDADIQKTSLLNSMIEEDSLTGNNFNALVTIVGHLNADIDKKSMLIHILRKRSPANEQWDGILAISSQLNADMDKQEMIHELADVKTITETQWISLIKLASDLNADMDKANTFVFLAKKMPVSDNLKTAYLISAKKINSDSDFGRVIKAIE